MPLRNAPPLPIDTVLPALLRAVAERGAAVLVAAPGAGKTTRLPLALLDADWRGDGRILVLEPRRLAARAAAEQMSRLLGESVGHRVGYRVRLESRVSERTRVEVITDGVFLRMIQDDPSLDGVAAVCFDEFHERHLSADLGLALALESRNVLRPDLRILVMSATLEPAPVARLLGTAGVAAPIIESAGRAYPVTTAWRPLRDGMPMARGVAQAVREVRREHPGDVLVFLPGIAELHRTRAALEEAPLGARVDLLHGSLTLDEQDRVLRPREPGPRVILSTAIAESSVTLDGVRVVVDAGLARVPRYDPRSGMSRLETVRVSLASADQRRGRAGRSAPGHCLRLWDEGQQASMSARSTPEVLEADLTPLALELACAGLSDAAALSWLDLPPAGALAQGRALLHSLGALDGAGRVTSHGRAMAALGIAPRLAHLVLAGAMRGMATLSCEVAALLAERDILRREAAEHDADLRTRVEALRGRDRGSTDPARLHRVRQEARALRRAVSGGDDSGEDLTAIGELVALAYPDRIAQRRAGSAPRYLLSNGRGARCATPQPLGESPYLAIADLDGDPAESRIWLAAALDESALRRVASAQIVVDRDVSWDDAGEKVRAFEVERLGALVLRERPLRDVTPDDLTAALLRAIRLRGVAALPWSDADRALRARLAFAHRHIGLPYGAVDDAALSERLDEWLTPALGDARRWSDLRGIALGDALLAHLPWAARTRLDEIAPTHIQVPSGSRIRVDYSDIEQPVLAVKLQECFGLTATPRLADGRVPLTMHLLSPAGRPVQVTKDLASFWQSGYFDVRKDLKGRYPRHPWPDDPLSAPATRRAKPRGT